MTVYAAASMLLSVREHDAVWDRGTAINGSTSCYDANPATPEPQQHNPSVNHVPRARDGNLLDNPVFLCGHRKSGTTILVCLFDSHPELLTYPCDSGFFYKVFPACLSSGKAQSVTALVDHTIRHCLRKEMANVERPQLFDVDAIAMRSRQSRRAPRMARPSLCCNLYSRPMANCAAKSPAAGRPGSRKPLRPKSMRWKSPGGSLRRSSSISFAIRATITRR